MPKPLEKWLVEALFSVSTNYNHYDGEWWKPTDIIEKDDLEDGSEYLFRQVEIKENIDLAVKVKYAPQVEEEVNEEEQGFNWIWIVVACGAVVLIAAGAVIFVVLKKKSKK